MAWNYQRSPQRFEAAPVHPGPAASARWLKPAVALQRVVSGQGPQAAEILALQWLVGNRAAVQRLISMSQPV